MLRGELLYEPSGCGETSWRGRPPGRCLRARFPQFPAGVAVLSSYDRSGDERMEIGVFTVERD